MIKFYSNFILNLNKAKLIYLQTSMKLFSTIILFILAISTNAIGQTKYGFMIGGNLSDQFKRSYPVGLPSAKIETKILPGLQAGIFLKQDINSKWAFETAIQFITVASRTKYTRTDFIVNEDGSITGPTTGYFNDRICKIEIPAILQYRIGKLYAGLGPSVGIIVSSMIHDYQNNSFKNYNSIDFGGNAIIGYSFSKKAGTYINYNYGLLDIDKNDHATVKNRSLAISFTYLLN